MLVYSRRKAHCRVLGPGVRAVVWFHGCSRHCPGCIAKEMNEESEVQRCTPEELYAWLSQVQGIEGVTMSGCEPLVQDAADMLRLLQLIRADERRLSVLVFTGGLLEEIQADSQLAKLLPYIDVLVDGPFVQELNDGRGLRGSSNQRIHCLTERYRPLERMLTEQPMREIEIELTEAGQLEMSGIPHTGFMENFQRQLAAQGFDMT